MLCPRHAKTPPYASQVVLNAMHKGQKYTLVTGDPLVQSGTAYAGVSSVLFVLLFDLGCRSRAHLELCVLGRKTQARQNVLQQLGGASSAVQLFGRLAVLETHTLRY